MQTTLGHLAVDAAAAVVLADRTLTACGFSTNAS
jgi:hypothetical protein